MSTEQNEYWPPCILCGRPAMHFIAHDIAICEYCFAGDYK